MNTSVALLALASLSIGFADTVRLRDGRVVNGNYLGGTARQVRMEVSDRIESFDVGDIAGIEFRAFSAANDPAPASRERERERDGDRVTLRRPSVSESSSNSGPSRGADVPAGTVLKVRMIDSVDSQVNQLGQTFQASLDEPVTINGETIIPRGADVVAKLVDDKQSGKISGRTELTLDLVSIRVNGRMVDLNTEEVTTSSESRTGRSSKVIGGTAALGAIIGAIAGGGKGAAVGAVSGAGAGTAVQVLTKGQRVRIPAETRLSFTLQSAVRI